MSMQDESRGSADDELLARLVGGDESALRALHRRHAALVFTVAARFVDPSAAEEVVQDVFMTLWRKHDHFDPKRGALATWLRQLARHAALNVLRRQRRAAKETDDEPNDVAD